MVVNMKLIKIIGLFTLICLTFFYTEKVIEVAINQDEIMIRIKEYAEKNNQKAINATIINDTITPGNIGRYVDTEASYKVMKKIGYFEPTEIIYKNIYPETSIYNNYHKYLINGNGNRKIVSLLYIINNGNTIDDILNISNKYQIKLNFFIDSNYLNNHINIIDKIKNNEIYNYGGLGKYTKDNLIIANNIINNKANNKATFCLFLKRDSDSQENCANSKMLSLIPKTNITSFNIKNNIASGSMLLIDNSKELNGVIEYILSKGYRIVPLSELIYE